MQNLVPDIQFKSELRKLSGSELNDCMQCGNCSAVCSLAPAEKPFPRKEMSWAGWGMKDMLTGNPDIWLCHQCGDCSSYCPRNVRPSDVLAAVRHISYRHYARPRFLGRLLSGPKGLPLAILIPVLVITGILSLAGTFRIPEGPVEYSRFFPHAWLNSSFTLIFFTIILMSFSGLRKFWKDMKMKFPEFSAKKSFIKSAFRVLTELARHKKFDSCKTQPSRKVSHFLVFYGFILLLFVTAFAIYAAISGRYPLSLWNPFKLLGNLASVMLVTGLGIMIFNRLFRKDKAGHSNYSDWLFLVSLLILTITGILVEAARFRDWSLAYHLYFFHLCTVWFVIIYLPYIKFGHILYRTTALIFSEMTGRK